MKAELKKFNKRVVTIVVLCLCILLCAVGGVFAYLTDKTDPLENTFVPTKVTCLVDETFEGGVKSNVKVRNTGDVNAYIRAAVIATFVSNDGKVYSKAPIEGVDYTIVWSNDKWQKGSDGFWYYSDSVKPSAFTANLIETATENVTPEGYNLNLQIIATAIQSDPDAAVQSAWGITPISGKIKPN